MKLSCHFSVLFKILAQFVKLYSMKAKWHKIKSFKFKENSQQSFEFFFIKNICRNIFLVRKKFQNDDDEGK